MFIASATLGIIRQCYATIAINLGVFSLGTVVAWTSAGLTNLEKDFHLSIVHKSWISSIINIGGLVSCLSAGFIIDKLGRKFSAILLSVPLMIGWLILIFSQNVEMLYISRFILGYAASFYGVVGPVFVGEIASANIRGALSNLYGVFLTFGMLFSYVVGSFTEWKMLSISCAGVPIILVCSLLFVAESPRHLLQIGEVEKGRECLNWYRGGLDVDEEVKQIMEEQGGTFHKKDKTISIFSRESLIPLIICIVLVLFEQWSGFAAIVAFTSDIFKYAGHSSSENILAIIFGVLQLLATCLSCVLVDKMGRRPLLLMGEVVMIASLGFLGFYFFYLEKEEFILVSKWASVVCLGLYITAFSAGIGPISTTIMGEILPQNVRGVGSAICTAILRISAFLISFSFEPARAGVGSYSIFWFYTAVCLMAFIVIYLFIPETKGKTLEDISTIFKKQKSLSSIVE